MGMESAEPLAERVEASVEERRESRRRVIKRAAKAGSVAWVAPLVLDGITNPAAAATCAKGNFNVVFRQNMSQISPTGLCTATGTNTTAAAVGLTYNTVNIAHAAASPGNIGIVNLSIVGCTCRITGVTGVVHLRGAGTCPTVPCQPASSGGYLNITSGALNTTAVSVQPSTAGLCAGTALHWGANQSGSLRYDQGYLVVQITCG